MVNFVFGIQVTYWYTVFVIGPEKTIYKGTHSLLFHESLWVSIGETGPIKMDTTSPTELALDTTSLGFNDGSKAKESFYRSGFRLAGLVARNILLKKKKVKNWHLKNVIISGWVTNNYSAEEAAEYLFRNAYFGYDIYSIEQAASFYFDKSKDLLTAGEIISLVTIMDGPNVFSPYCRIDLFERKRKYLVDKLVEFSPQKYERALLDNYSIVPNETVKCKS
ncbi:MAG: transglycosylase domain-containing protein [Kangiellaceae bacterium]|nr:transglycosylase domain-containing protein [Kangiellaceae bacterium]